MVKFISESHFKATIKALVWFKIAVFILRPHRHHIWGKVFKNEPSEMLFGINMGININLLSRGWKMFHNNM